MKEKNTHLHTHTAADALIKTKVIKKQKRTEREKENHIIALDQFQSEK